MEDQVEAGIVKRQRLRHIGSDDIDMIPFPGGHQSIPLQLFPGIIQHAAVRAPGDEDRHLLPAAAGQAQPPPAFQIAQPVLGHGLGRGQHHLPLPCQGLLIILVRYGNAPFPAFVYPAVDGAGIDIRIVHIFSPV